MSDDKPKKDGRDAETGRFLTGNNGGGRKKGSKNKLGEDYLDDLLEVWQERGKAALVVAIQREPMQFCKMVAGILPREVLVKAFSLNVDADAKDMADAESVEEILEIVAQEAGPEAAEVLAKMFGLEPPIELNAERPMHNPSHAYNPDGTFRAEYLADNNWVPEQKLKRR